MKMKKLFSFILVMATALAVTVPASAEGGNKNLLEEVPEWVDVQIEEEVQEPEPEPEPDQEPDPEPEQSPSESTPTGEPEQDSETAPPEDPPPAEENGDLIEVVVPAVGKVIFNPYGLAVETETGETKSQIIHQPQTLVNNSDFPVSVNTVVTGAIAEGSPAHFVAAIPAAESVEKELFLYAEFQKQADTWSGSYTGAANQVLVSAEGTAGENVLVLDANGAGYFRLFGAMTTNVDPMWGSDDAVTITLAYNFAKAEQGAGEAEKPEDTNAGEALPDAAPQEPEASPEETVPPEEPETAPPASEEEPAGEMDEEIIIEPPFGGEGIPDMGDAEETEETEILDITEEPSWLLEYGEDMNIGE